MPIGRRTGFEANAAAAPISATPARAFNATALTNKYYYSLTNLSINLKYRGKNCLAPDVPSTGQICMLLMLNDRMLIIDIRYSFTC